MSQPLRNLVGYWMTDRNLSALQKPIGAHGPSPTETDPKSSSTVPYGHMHVARPPLAADVSISLYIASHPEARACIGTAKNMAAPQLCRRRSKTLLALMDELVEEILC
jgi:hypothetical protein